MSSEELSSTADYRAWIGDLKARFRSVQLKAAVAVNTALLQFYWELGADIVVKQADHAWGSGFVKQLSRDLVREFPEVKGFSERNVKYIRQWYEFWLFRDADSALSLDIRVSADGKNSSSRFANIAAHQQQVAEHLNCEHARAMLRQTHAIASDHRIGTRIGLRRLR